MAFISLPLTVRALNDSASIPNIWLILINLLVSQQDMALYWECPSAKPLCAWAADRWETIENSNHVLKFLVSVSTQPKSEPIHVPISEPYKFIHDRET